MVVTTHLYDGKKSLPLDIELYQHGNSLPLGKKDPLFKKKPELALGLIDQSLVKGEQPEIVLIDSGYGNNTTFLMELEKRKLKYLGGVAKNRIFEQKVQVEEDDVSLNLRRVVIQLHQPTRHGDTEVTLLTHLSPSVADAPTVARLYLQRWSKVNLKRFSSSPRGQKKPKPKPTYDPKHLHVSTSRLLRQPSQYKRSP